MTPFNVDIFDNAFNNIAHFEIDNPDIDIDYLCPENTSFSVPAIFLKGKDIRDGYLLHIDELKFWGTVKQYSDIDIMSEISVKPLMSIFDHDVIYDISLEKNQNITLETCIRDLIRSNWIQSVDEPQNYPIFKTRIISETSKWEFKFDPVYENGSKTVVNLLYDIIIPALEKYKISINISQNFSENELLFTIGVIEDTYVIEADLPSVTIDEFTIKDSSESINRLDVYDGYTFRDKKTFYLHSNGKYDQNDTDRVLPVRPAVSYVFPSETDTLEELALSEAETRMEAQSWKNLIELTFMRFDTLVKPSDMKYGQIVSIRHNGKTYHSVLTGKRINSAYITLVFGKIRFDLTKKVGK